jgi:hypothetical protein
MAGVPFEVARLGALPPVQPVGVPGDDADLRDDAEPVGRRVDVTEPREE